MRDHEQAVDLGAQAAQEWAESRNGWDLVGYRLVGLPYWRVRMRLRVLARKEIGPIDEHLLRAVGLGIDQPDDLGGLLGLDQSVLDAHLVDLLSQEAIKRKTSGLGLTQTGRDLATETARVVSEIRTVDLDWDGLLRRPTAPLESWVQPAELKRAGLREVPATPPNAPELPELRAKLAPIQQIIRQLTQDRDGFDLLDVGGIERRHRIYRTAIALAFRSQTGPDTQIAFAVDGRLSTEHEEAFARAGLAKRFSVGERGLPSFKRQLDDLLPDVIEAGRPLAPHQYSDVLDIAFERSTKRLLIWTPSIHEATLTRARRDQLTNLLERGVDVRIAVLSTNHQRLPLGAGTEKALRELASDHSNLHLGTVRRLGPGVLISDQQALAAGGYDWLGQIGDVLPGIRDMGGRLVTDPEMIDATWERLNDVATALPRPEDRKPQRRPSTRGKSRRVEIEGSEVTGVDPIGES